MTSSDYLGRSSSPTSPSERIDAIDVLRGLALFGVVAINVVTEFRVSIFEQFLPPAKTTSPLDRAVEIFLTMAFELKAFALFSFLFGAGLAIQFERLGGQPRRMTLLVRRLTVLLMIGLAHLFLIWNGDILAEYALAGFIALPFLLGPSWLLASGAALFLGLYLIMPLLPPVVSWPSATWMADHIVAAKHAYGTGGFSEVLAFRIREVPSILPLHVLVFPRTIALILLGACTWQSGVLRCAAAHRRLLFAVAGVGLLIGAVLTLVGSGLFEWPSPGRWSLPVERLATVILASGYGAAVIGLASLWPRFLSWAAPLGRMAFTNYLAQSVIFGWIFYGYGLGLFGRLGATAGLAIAVGVYVAQVVASAWWLRRYRFGPVEWLWRTLMYGERQSMRAPIGP